METCAKHILDENCALADAWSMVLSNVSRPEQLAEQAFNESQSQIEALVTAFTRIGYNKNKCHLNYLSMETSNWLYQRRQLSNEYCYSFHRSNFQ